MAVGDGESYQIYMNVLKSPIGHGKVADRGNCMPSHFCLLAGNAFSGPFSNVGVHLGPNHLGSDGLSGPFNPWVAQAVNGIEDLFPESQRDKGACGSVAAVDYEIVATDIDAFKVQSGPSIVPDSPELRIQGLLSRYGGPVDPQVGDCVDDACQILSSGCCASGCVWRLRRAS